MEVGGRGRRIAQFAPAPARWRWRDVAWSRRWQRGSSGGGGGESPHLGIGGCRLVRSVVPSEELFRLHFGTTSSTWLPPGTVRIPRTANAIVPGQDLLLPRIRVSHWPSDLLLFR